MKRGSNGGLLLFVAVCVLILCSVSFYVALSNYLLDEDFNVASPAYARASDNVYRAERVEQEVQLSKDQLGNQTQACVEVRERIEQDFAQLDPSFVQLFNELNATIEQMNATCRSEIASMTTTLMQIINMTNNVTYQVVNNGVCQFGTNMTHYQYRRLSLNQLEFYLYAFTESTSSVPAGGRIEGCSPQLFKTNVQTPVLFSALEIDAIGQNAVQFANVNLTHIPEGFQIWVNLF